MKEVTYKNIKQRFEKEKLHMNIQNISKKDKNVTVELNANELVTICNVLALQYTELKDKESYLQLYSDMALARDLCQYGHVDNFCLTDIVHCRNKIGNGLNGICVLSDDEIDTFNAYLENDDNPTAFGNTNWNRIYNKIVGKRRSKKAEQWMKQE